MVARYNQFAEQTLTALFCVCVLGACSDSNNKDEPVYNEEESSEYNTRKQPVEYYAHKPSPDGKVSATVYHHDSSSGGLTQVKLEYTGLGCGSGSAAWHEYDIGIGLHWVDASTLEVTYPDGKQYSHNPSGDYLGCRDRLVRVVMVPAGATVIDGKTYTEPVETGHMLSPEGDISAYTFRYDSPRGGVTQVVLQFVDVRGCADSAVTFYNGDIDLNLTWTDAQSLEVGFPDGQRYDLPPWGTSVRCVTRAVEVSMQPE